MEASEKSAAAADGLVERAAVLGTQVGGDATRGGRGWEVNVAGVDGVMQADSVGGNILSSNINEKILHPPSIIKSIVEKTVKSLNRKKYNVVVSGLCETGTEAGDKLWFADLCDRFMNIEPVVVKCMRLCAAKSVLGAPVGQRRPRLLLVTLTTEVQAINIVRCANLLRDADDDVIRNRIYINKDMTRDEAASAYERRAARRTKPNNFNTMNTAVNLLSAVAMEFHPRGSSLSVLTSISVSGSGGLVSGPADHVDCGATGSTDLGGNSRVNDAVGLVIGESGRPESGSSSDK